ncbi:MAG: hypothetical protein K9G33_14730 [Sneathiella sp.]|nr:hypothetical protein [Sneathiella sp.]
MLSEKKGWIIAETGVGFEKIICEEQDLRFKVDDHYLIQNQAFALWMV